MKNTNKTANRTASNNNTASKPASKPEKTIVPMGKTASTVDVAALEARLAAAEAALLKSEADKAALQAKVKTSARREVKAPSSYDVMQPIFVAVRGSIGKGIVLDVTLKDIFQATLKELQITLTPIIQATLIDRTIAHNSISNMAKARDYSSAIGRFNAFIEMYHQAMVLLPNIPALENSPLPEALIKAAGKAGFDIEIEAKAMLIVDKE